MNNYQSECCDLCSSTLKETIIDMSGKQGMLSDLRFTERPLYKVICSNCGLVREGNNIFSHTLSEQYVDEYQLNTQNDEEHYFYRSGDMIPRSQAIAEWVNGILDETIKNRISSILEVGAGQGNLIRQLKQYFPNSSIIGSELNKQAVVNAQNKGINVKNGTHEDLEDLFDLIISITVIEHVPSPFDFLKGLANQVNDGGYIIIGQPMQDVKSYDIFFTDHLYHFHTQHIEWLGNKAGLEQVGIMKSPWFAENFSLHLFKKATTISEPNVHFVESTVPETAKYWDDIFNRVNEMTNRDKTYAIYGLGEIASLLYVYSDLKHLNIIMGIDDTGTYKKKKNIFNIPSYALDELSVEDLREIDGVIIAMNPMYHSTITEKCLQKGLKVINFINLNVNNEVK